MRTPERLDHKGQAVLAEPNWVVRGVLVDDGSDAEFAIVEGHLSESPSEGAELLPGTFILAGLVDAHVHLALDLGGSGRPAGSADVVADSLRALLHAGVLLARDAGAPVGVRVGGDHTDGPEVLACGRFLAPPNGYLPDLYEGVSAADLDRIALDELAASGSGWVKLVFDFPEHFTGPASLSEAVANYAPGVVRSLCDAVHAAGGRVAAHVSGPGDAQAAIDLGVDSLEHGPDVPLDALESFGARGGAWTPTMLTVWRDGRAHSPQATWQRNHYREALAVARAAGVVVLAGTDAAGAGTVAEEIALLASLGLSPAEAIAAGSTAARDYLGCPGLCMGSHADLVTFHDDPRADLEALKRPAAIIRRGRRVA